MDSQTLLYLVPVSGALALIFAILRGTWINKQDAGDERMTTIANADPALERVQRNRL